MKSWLCLIAVPALLNPDLSRAAQPDAAATNAPAGRPHRTFQVRGFQVEGNTVLPPPKINAVLTNCVGPAVTFRSCVQGVGELQLLYRRSGFATVNVTIPHQRLTNGIVQLNVIEGRLTGS